MQKENISSASNVMDGQPESKSGTIQIDDQITVEQYLEMKCEIMIQELKQHAEVLCGKLRSELEEGKTEVLSALSDSVAAVREQNVIVVAVEGSHQGQKWKLQPRNGKSGTVCWLGRSSGKKFREKGVSLKKDSEVSTSHGKIEAINGKIFYTDTGSSNGSHLVGGESLEEGEPYELTNGTRLQLGSTILTFELVYV
mmetsp:Transcript_5065/g.6992  ORF Transcript_5065/g.6992 Transcript_5065/m.6992 type:complete len:197 (-) Transcript_5065:116-706(-)